MHPQMTMSQNGGYLLAGTRLCQHTGMNKLDKSTVHELRAKLGGGRKQLTCLQKKNKGGGRKRSHGCDGQCDQEEEEVTTKRICGPRCDEFEFGGRVS